MIQKGSCILVSDIPRVRVAHIRGRPICNATGPATLREKTELLRNLLSIGQVGLLFPPLTPFFSRRVCRAEKVVCHIVWARRSGRYHGFPCGFCAQCCCSPRKNSTPAAWAAENKHGCLAKFGRDLGFRPLHRRLLGSYVHVFRC